MFAVMGLSKQFLFKQTENVATKESLTILVRNGQMGATPSVSVKMEPVADTNVTTSKT